jgi:hypothetical protein
MQRRLATVVNTRLSTQEHRLLIDRANHHGLRTSEYLRSVILADLEQRQAQTLLQTVEAEHTRLILVAAQQQKRLSEDLIKELRDQAILAAPSMVEKTVRLLEQAQMPRRTEEE